MNYVDSTEFVLRAAGSGVDTSAWLWGITIFIVSLFFIGLFWGRLWNRRWSLLGHKSTAVFSLICALLAAYAVLNWRVAETVQTWIENQQSQLTRSLTDSGAFNRGVHRSAWEKLQPLGGQTDLTPPSEAGNELRLNSESDSRVLAAEAASEVKLALLGKKPFTWGLPCMIKDPEAVADEVIETIAEPAYPVIVSPENEIAASAVAIQVRYAIESATNGLTKPMSDLRTAAKALLLVVLLLQILFVPMAAMKDIKDNPRPLD